MLYTWLRQQQQALNVACHLTKERRIGIALHILSSHLHVTISSHIVHLVSLWMSLSEREAVYTKVTSTDTAVTAKLVCLHAVCRLKDPTFHA